MYQEYLTKVSDVCLLLLLLFVNPILAVTNIAGWSGLRGTQIRSKIILEGGIRNEGQWTGSTWSNTSIPDHSYGIYYQIDLDRSFNAKNDSTDDYMKNPGVKAKENPLAPNYAYGAIFNNDYQWYSFGGLADQKPLDGINTVSLGLVFPPDPSVTVFNQGVSPFTRDLGGTDYTAGGAYASAPDQGLGFYFGGMVGRNRGRLEYLSGDKDDNHPTVADQRFIQVDMTTPNEATFEELTWPSAMVSRSEGALVWLPFGKKGVLVAIGGVEIPRDMYISDPPRLTPNGLFMTELAIYDIDGKAWHIQNTLETGKRPSQLASFCTATVPTQDGHGYEVFVYGGYDGTYNSSDRFPRDDVWVLSLPAFQWTQVLEADPQSTHRRQGNICIAPNPTTMITIGGSDQVGSPLKSDTIVDVLDLNTMEWTGIYNASSTDALILRPEVVTQLSYSSPDGPGTSEVNFLNGTELNTLFSTMFPGRVTKYWPYNTTVPNDTVATSSNNWKKPVIATLCSVVPASIVALIIVYCVRKQRRNKQGIARTQRSRLSIFSWLGKSSHFDPDSEKSIGSEDTAVDNRPDNFHHKNINGEMVFEAPSNSTSPGWRVYEQRSPGLSEVMDTSSNSVRHEIMSQPLRESTSIQNYPHHPPSLSGDRTMSARSGSVSYPSETLHSAKYHAHSLSYELSNTEPGMRSPTNLDQDEPQFIEAKDTPSDTAVVGSGQPSPTVGATPRALNKQKSLSYVGSVSPETANRPNHTRNLSSMSSSVPNLLTPTMEEDQRRSQDIDELPDMPSLL